MDEGRGKLLRNLREPILDKRQRAALAGREHVAVRSLSLVLVELELEHVMQMAEGLLLRHDGDVILAGVGDEFRNLRRRQRAARRRGQRMIRIKQRVLKIRRVDIDLERSEDANLMLLEFERGKRAAGEIVVDAAILHGRPVAHGARGKHARRSGQWQQLLESLHAVKNTGAGCANNGGLVRADDQNVALRFHGRIEDEIVGCESRLRCVGVIAQKRDAIRRLRGSGLVRG